MNFPIFAHGKTYKYLIDLPQIQSFIDDEDHETIETFQRIFSDRPDFIMQLRELVTLIYNTDADSNDMDHFLYELIIFFESPQRETYEVVIEEINDELGGIFPQELLDRLHSTATIESILAQKKISDLNLDHQQRTAVIDELDRKIVFLQAELWVRLHKGPESTTGFGYV